MSDLRESLSTGADDDETLRLLRLAGPRASVSSVRAARVRSAVLAEWQAARRRRADRRRFALLGSLLGVAVLLGVAGRGWPTGALAKVGLLERWMTPPGEPVAVVYLVEGSPDLGDGRNRVRLQRDDTVRIGEWIETGAHSRVALRFGDTTSVRVDTGSRLRALSPGVIELSAGAVYVDAGRDGSQLEVRTPLAVARDIGTQFEVRLVDGALRLRVRTGIVELKDRERSISGRAGTEITLSASAP